MSALRPLPPRPSLEFERKEAKAFLRQLRAGEPGALARARLRHPALSTNNELIQLADAQLVIAREYGFTSWPRLQSYFDDVERQMRPVRPRQFHSWPAEDYDRMARRLIADHARGRAMAARTFAAYVPRFYGMRVEEVFATDVTQDDARLALARREGCPGWDALLERAASQPDIRRDYLEPNPLRRAVLVMQQGDVEGLQRVVELHPELLHPTEHDLSTGGYLMSSALQLDRERGQSFMQPTLDWLETRGFSVQGELNLQLCGHMFMKPAKVAWLLSRGADPEWVAPNGISALEHAILQYWNGEAVDVLAARATHKDAFWIAAGLGDVAGVARFLDHNGAPTSAARASRPDFSATPMRAIPCAPEAPDEDVLMEAFLVAFLNARLDVMEYMVSRGFPVDSMVLETPLINLAVGNGWVPQVECLLRCGANIDIAGAENGTARDQALARLEGSPGNEQSRRIAELCGIDVAATVKSLDARPLPTPVVAEKLAEALECASDDAGRLGQASIRVDNLLFGLLRAGSLPALYFLEQSEMDRDRFVAEHEHRLRPSDSLPLISRLPLDEDAKTAVDSAVAIAAGRRRERVFGLHLLLALTQSGDGHVVDLLKAYGGDVAQLNTSLKRGA